MVTCVGLGVGQGPSPQAQRALDSAELLIGGTRLLALLADSPALRGVPRWDMTGRLRELTGRVGRAVEQGQRVVVVASGDPMFFGVGGYLVPKLRALDIAAQVLPAPNCVAEAAARLGLKWSDAKVLSVHGRPLGDIAGALTRHGKVAVLTDPTNSPSRICESLVQSGVQGQAHVVEAMGSERERCRSLSIAQVAQLRDIDPLNVLILQAPATRPTVPYVEDEAFEKKMPRKGLITKREVRALSMAALGVRLGDVCWDLGAGSGAVSIDMARCGAKAVHAVEKNADGCEIIAANVRSHGALQVQVHHHKAPTGLEQLPDPDRVFIGGSGGNMAQLVALSLARLRAGGSLVVNVATVENLALSLEAIREAGVQPQALQVQVARSRTILGRLTRFEALNPVTIVSAAPPARTP